MRYTHKHKSNLQNICKIGSKGYINILNPWLPGKESQIEFKATNILCKRIESKISIYANQIKMYLQLF